MTLLLVTLLAAVGLACVHLFSGSLRFLGGSPRSAWLSIAGGVSVAYVFVHLLPELGEGQEVLAEAAGEGLAFLERHVYLVALLGLAVFYGLERLAKLSRDQVRRQNSGKTSAEVFWLHVGSFAFYNTIIGYLLVRREAGLGELLFFFAAMALHFLVNDHGLREHHEDRYDRIGRWILAGAVLIGWTLGALTAVSEAALVTLTAFLGGGVILNVLKEELPEERESRFWAFALGSATYALLLLAAF